MIQSQTTPGQSDMNASVESAPHVMPIRPALLTDGPTLQQYGPVLRRLTVGLLDEVAEINLICLEPSSFLDFIPSPPVRLFTQAPRTLTVVPKILQRSSRHVKLITPALPILERVMPRRLSQRLFSKLAEYKPNLIHALGESSFLAARQLSKQLQIPYLISTLTLGKHTIAYAASRCQGILSCDAGTTQVLQQQYPSMAQKIRHLPIGTHVPEDACCFAPVRDRPVIACVTQLDRSPAVGALIEALVAVKEAGHRPLLIIAGKGPGEPAVRRLIQELNISGNVQIVPPPPDVIPQNDSLKTFFGEADIFVLPGRQKYWSPELLEAMSMGNLAITARESFSDLVTHEKTGLTITPGDARQLAQTLIRVLSDPPLARQLARAGQQHVREHFLASRMVINLTEIYRQAVMNKSA